MKYIFGLLIIAWLTVLQVIELRTDYISIASTLGALCFFIIKQKYLDKAFASIAYFIAAAALAQFRPPFILLAAIPLLDFVYGRMYWLAAPALAVAAYISVAAGEYFLILPLLMSAYAGHIAGTMERSEQAGIKILDDERCLRYNLEMAQNELIRSRREVERLTEARERNRIAHELHDSIGHGIAGVLIQLEAAQRIHRRDADKADEILSICVQKLSETLELTRNTVYNLRTDIKTGVEALENIISGFRFCPVDFQHSGDFGMVSPTNMSILEANVTEALTNSSRHSHATQIIIKVDIRRNNIRLYYKDNGIGCKDIRESLGLMGMRDRVKDAGGTISIDGSGGFLIVCNLPEHENESGS